MRNLGAIQLTTIILISVSLCGMFMVTDVYEDVESGIVSLLCLSCIKLEYKTVWQFTFDTATGDPHPDCILQNLSEGPVFLAFREDVCLACDEMEPIIQRIFNVSFEKEDTFSTVILFNSTNITFFHININHATPELRALIDLYDKDHTKAVPMFTMITLGYNHGFIKPFYASGYGKLNVQTDEERTQILTKIIQDGIALYIENYPGYHH